MKTFYNPSGLLFTLLCGGMLFLSSVNADTTTPATTTTTTTVTAPDGTTTTTVEETTATEDPADSQETTPTHQPNLIGPTGATGVIRRSDRRQDRRTGNPRID